jgi:hypothetical protein
MERVAQADTRVATRWRHWDDGTASTCAASRLAKISIAC